MKKIFSFAFAAAALFAAVSCQKVISNGKMESNTDGFTVTVSHCVATKTTLVEGFKTYWTYEDELTVFDAQLTNRCFAYRSSEDNGKTAVFETPEFIMPSEEHLATSPLVAVYPYNEALTFAYPEMTLTGLNIPAAQVAKADNFDPTATIALAFSNAAGKDNLTFNNLYSLLKLEVRKDDVKKVTVKANGDNDKLVGTGSIQFNQLGGYEFTMTEGTNEVVLSGEFVKDNTYYVAVAPGTYANGFSVYLDDTQVKTTTDSKTLQANYVYNLGNLKASRNLKFSAESVTVTLGDAFTAPELTGEKDGAVFTSSNEEVATVDQTGAVTVIGVGETIITAMAAENESYLSGDASYTLTVKQAKVYLYVKNDMAWTKVNVYGWLKNDESKKLTNDWPGNQLTFEESVNGNVFYRFEIPEAYVGKEIGLVFNNGSKQLSDCFITLTQNTYIRLTPGTPIVVDPNDKSSFKYRIYVYDQAEKKNVNIHYWGDGVTGTNYPGIKITDYVKYDNKALGYYEIPAIAYSGKVFNYLLNVNGDELKTADLSVSNPTSDLYIGYWNNNGGKGFWMNNDKPFTSPDECK